MPATATVEAHDLDLDALVLGAAVAFFAFHRGQRLLLDTLCQRHNHERRSGRAFAEIQADAYCSLSLQLGWVICRQNVLSVVKVDEADLLKRMTSIVNWFVTRSW